MDLLTQAPSQIFFCMIK